MWSLSSTIRMRLKTWECWLIDYNLKLDPRPRDLLHPLCFLGVDGDFRVLRSEGRGMGHVPPNGGILEPQSAFRMKWYGRLLFSSGTQRKMQTNSRWGHRSCQQRGYIKKVHLQCLLLSIPPPTGHVPELTFCSQPISDRYGVIGSAHKWQHFRVGRFLRHHTLTFYQVSLWYMDYCREV